jgi:hypothetical protein
MKSYNGYTPAQRNKAQAWLNSQWRAGKLQRPCVCHACGQKEGIIDAHAEDYSEPFAAGKTDQYHLCFQCHMMVHCRFRNLDKWRWYKQAVADGMTFEPYFARDFGRFSRDTLQGMPKMVAFGEARTDLLGKIA